MDVNLVEYLEQTNAEREFLIERKKNPTAKRKGVPAQRLSLEQMLKKDEEWKNTCLKEGISLQEAITPATSSLLTTSVIMGEVQRYQDNYTKLLPLFQTINYDSTARTFEIISPFIGPVRAHKVGPGQNYEEVVPDETLSKNISIKIEKYGIMMRITDEMRRDASWNYLNVWLNECGRAMGRIKEEIASLQIKTYARTIIDPDDATLPSPTGRNRLGVGNNTMSMEDYVDFAGGLWFHEYMLTHIMMHPWVYWAQAKTAFYGGLTYVGYPNGSPQPLAGAAPNSAVIAAQIPGEPIVILAPEVGIDKIARTTDIYACDATNLGVYVVDEELMMEEWRSFGSDTENIKFRTQFAIGIPNDAEHIIKAANIAIEPTFPYKVQLTKAL